MIVDVWGIKTTRRKKLYCFLADTNHVISKCLKGYIVRYKCDNISCKDRNKIHTTTTSSLYISKWNNIEKQMCRSCRSVKAEKIKCVTIEYSKFKSLLELEDYKMLTNKKDYDNAIYPSQFKIDVICPNDHKYKITWNNWSKGKRCRRCYEEQKVKDSVKYIDGFALYKLNVKKFTKISYKKFKNYIDPNCLRNRDNQLDHKYSKAEGFKNGILPIIIGSYINLEILTASENASKNYRCSITKEELFDEYNRQIKFIQGGTGSL